MAIILIVLLVIFILLFLQQLRRNQVSHSNWPLVGMLPNILINVNNIHDYITDVLKKSGGTLEFKGPMLANKDCVVTCDPLNVQYILNKNFSNYPKGPKFKKIFEPLGDGIFISDFDLWKSQRKLFQSLIGRNKFESFMVKTIQRKVLDSLIPLLDHFSNTGAEVDLKEVFARLTFDNICLLVLGFDPVSLSIEFPEIECEKAYHDFEVAAVHRHVLPEKLWKLQRWLQMGQEKRLTKACKIFDDFLLQHISIKRLQFTNSTNLNYNSDMLTVYLEENEKQNGVFKNSDKFLRDTAFNFMLGGRDTLSSSLSWLFWLVATNPIVETKIIQEMKDKIVKSSPNNKEEEEEEQQEVIKLLLLEPKELNKLVYLHAAICETLRLYPSVPINHKSAIEEDILPSGHCVKKNQVVLLSYYAMGRIVNIWGENCFEFKPERWINSENGELIYVPSYKFAAFNSGPRTCLGKEMSFTQMKIVAAFVLWNYRIEVVEGHPIAPNVSVVLHMKYGLRVKVSRRAEY